MARNNRADGPRSDLYDKNDHRLKTCGTCGGGAGSSVDRDGKHVGACGTCGGFGQVDR